MLPDLPEGTLTVWMHNLIREFEWLAQKYAERDAQALEDECPPPAWMSEQELESEELSND